MAMITGMATDNGCGNGDSGNNNGDAGDNGVDGDDGDDGDDGVGVEKIGGGGGGIVTGVAMAAATHLAD
jgi:hypothetical protein